MRLPPEEPAAGPWRVEPIADVAGTLLGRPPAPAGRPLVLAVDGRGSSGKTSLSRRLAEAVPGAAVVHTDDIAWWHAAFDWAGLLAGAVTVPAGLTLLIVEGVGSSRQALAHLLDAGVWVQSDLDEIDRRNAVRVQAGEISPAAFDSWMAKELPFLAADRPWERARLIVAGTPPLTHDPRTELVVADPPPVLRR
jgi:hypothetical protein